MVLHNLVFLVDVDYGEETKQELTERNTILKRGILQILLHLGFRYGLDKVRWGYKLFGSRSSRSSSLLSRSSDFRELQHKAFQDLEMDLDSKVSMRSQRKTLSSPAASVQNALKETLLDFQWDRPDITSPTKASLRVRRSGRNAAAASQMEDSLSDGRSLLLVMSQCPRSTEQMEQYLWSPAGGDVSEKLLSRSLMEMMVQRTVTLHWLDTASHQQIMSCVDHSGADTLSRLLSPLGGRLLPLWSLLELGQSSSDLSVWSSSVWGFLLSPEPGYRLCFPVGRATVELEHGDAVQRCVLQVEPVSSSQRLLSSMKIHLKTVVLEQTSALSLDQSQSGSEVWVLHSPDQDWFTQILLQLKHGRFNMAAEVCEDGLSRSALLSPLSHRSALLSLTCSILPEHCPLQESSLSLPTPSAPPRPPEELPEVVRPSEELQEMVRPPEELPEMVRPSEELPEVVSSVLGVIYDIMEEDGNDGPVVPPPVPEWALQELSHTVDKHDFVQSWFHQSDLSGCSATLMENLRLLNAVPEDSSGDAAEHEFLSDLSELYQSSSNNRNKQKCGARRTPMKQKMKSMSRSLQMLNTARLNVKQAQRHQSDPEPGAAEKPKRKSSDTRARDRDGGHGLSFSSEAELLHFLKETYSKTMSDQTLSLSSRVQLLLSALRTYLGKDSEVQQCEFLQAQLLKSSRSVRSQSDTDLKTRECQLQSLLRLEMCRTVSLVTSHSVDTQQMAEEVAEMLRIISLTKDPVFLSRFLQDNLLLPHFLTSIPRLLADVYLSLGSQLPACLAAHLPSDFFSDDSVNKESPSEDPPSTVSVVSEGGEEKLTELRERSAAKRRSGRMSRHRSMTESSQRHIEVQLPKRSRPPTKTKVSEASEKPAAEVKQQTQEVTKVRRNLFNEETVSPSKRNKLPRSRSVSAVEGLKRKRSIEDPDHHKLLTKKVCETPLHKQVSQRLLHRQRLGRRSTPTELCIVEESPQKPTEDVRRSPRLKQFARRHSFYSSAQARSRNLERALTSSQASVSLCDVDVRTVRSPVRLLFGAAQSPRRSPRTSRQSSNKTPTKSPAQKDLCRNMSPKKPPALRMRFSESSASHTGNSRARPSSSSSVFESPQKTPSKSPTQKGLYGNTSPKTPPASRMRFSESPASNTRNSPFKSPTRGSPFHSPTTRGSPFHSPTTRGSPFHSPTTRGSPFHSPTTRGSPFQTASVSETPQKLSPLKSILKTPVKNVTTPKKTVTWSPTPQTPDRLRFKVPESPKFTTFRVKTPDKSGHKVEVLKTPDKLPHDVFDCQVSLVKMTESQTPNKSEELGSPSSQKKNQNSTLQRTTRSAKSLTFNTPEKQNSDAEMFIANSEMRQNKEQNAAKSPRSRRNEASVSKQNLEIVIEISPGSSPEIKIPIKPRREAKASLNFGNDRGRTRLKRQNSKSQSNEDLVASNVEDRGCSAGENICTEETGKLIPEKSRNKQKISISDNCVLMEDENGLLQKQLALLQDNEPNMSLCGENETAPKAKISKKAKSKSEDLVIINKKVKESRQEKQQSTRQTRKTRSNEEFFVDFDQNGGVLQKVPKTRSNDSNLSQRTDDLVIRRSPNLRTRRIKESALRDCNEGLVCEGESSSNVAEVSKESHSEDNIQTENSHNDTDSSLQLASTDEDSLDIINASVVKAQGLKMNISFSRKPSKTGDEFSADMSSPNGSNRSYGFRQTPDRRQREAAVRLGYANEFPKRFSTPRGTSKKQKDSSSTYEVQMELQSSGLPKLKLKRTDSDAGSPLVPRKGKVEAGCVSPSMCAHRTPAKGGKSGQTFICQSYTPTRSQTSPIALTPSPQSSGKLTPDYLNSWPRRKRVKVREEGPSKEPRLDKLQVERCGAEEEQAGESDLGVSRLPDTEEEQRKSPGLMWMDKMEEELWSGETANETPPSSRKRKPVTASGILALTSSPLLFKTSSASKTKTSTGDSILDLDVSPFGKPVRRSGTKTYSRKRLLS